MNVKRNNVARSRNVCTSMDIPTARTNFNRKERSHDDLLLPGRTKLVSLCWTVLYRNWTAVPSLNCCTVTELQYRDWTAVPWLTCRTVTDLHYCDWTALLWTAVLWLNCCTVTELLYCDWTAVLWLNCCTVTELLYCDCSTVTELQYCDWTAVLWLNCCTVTELQYCDWTAVLYLNCCTVTELLYCHWTAVLYLNITADSASRKIKIAIHSVIFPLKPFIISFLLQLFYSRELQIAFKRRGAFSQRQ